MWIKFAAAIGCYPNSGTGLNYWLIVMDTYFAIDWGVYPKAFVDWKLPENPNPVWVTYGYFAWAPNNGLVAWFMV